MTSIHLDEDFPATSPTKNPPQNFYQISPHLLELIKLIKCTDKSLNLYLLVSPRCQLGMAKIVYTGGGQFSSYELALRVELNPKNKF